ncbi:MAG: hypothetical protein QNK31_03550 [Porticoccus sp.]|nr:hypothetical protein [Porticoccus sp.]
MKTLFKIFAGLVVIVLVVLVVAVLNLDKGIKAAVETLGPELTQSSVTLKDVELSLTSGEGSLKGLVVGNPAGFKTPNAFSLGEIFIAIDPESVTTDTIVIKNIRIVAPEITYESAKGGTNLDQLQKNVEQALGVSDGASSEASAGESSVTKKLIIKDLKITGGKISYSNALLGDKPISLPLPAIQLAGIGEKSGGASAGEVVKQILEAINKNAAKAVTNSGALKDVGNKIKGQATEKVQEKLEGLKGLLNR